MKKRAVALLLLSHLGLALLGAWLAGGGEKEAVIAAADPVAAAPSPPPAVDPASANPILRASGADFRAAWEEMLAGPRSGSGEPHGNSINFFIDWCGVDPEGAVRGLARLHAPGFAHNYLGNAIQHHGAELAPALVKHWRDLRLIPTYKVDHAMGRALNALAKEDPEAAAALLGELPPGTRRETYLTLFDRHDLATIGRLVESLSTTDSAGSDKSRLWTAVAEAVDAADPERGLWDWLARADDPAARRALAEAGMSKARRAENWSGFFDSMEHLDPSAQAELREVVRRFAKNSGYRAEIVAAMSEECRRRGLEDWFVEPAGE